MAQNPYAQTGPYDDSGSDFGVPMEPGRTSVLAVLSLVCSLICCIPGLGLAGLALGVLAVLLIGGSKGRVGGRGLAVAGIVIGLLVTAAWLAIAFGAASFARQFSSVPDVLESVEQRDLAAVHAELSPTAQTFVGPDELERFAQEVQAEHGSYVGSYDSVLDIFGAYGELSGPLQNAFNAVNVSFTNAGRTLVPVPAEFDTGSALMVIVWPSSMTNPQTNSSGLPVFENIGIVKNDDTWIWLYPPPALGNTPTPVQVPATPDAPDTPDASDNTASPDADAEEAAENAPDASEPAEDADTGTEQPGAGS